MSTEKPGLTSAPGVPGAFKRTRPQLSRPGHPQRARLLRPGCHQQCKLLLRLLKASCAVRPCAAQAHEQRGAPCLRQSFAGAPARPPGPLHMAGASDCCARQSWMPAPQCGVGLGKRLKRAEPPVLPRARTGPNVELLVEKTHEELQKQVS